MWSSQWRSTPQERSESSVVVRVEGGTVWSVGRGAKGQLGIGYTGVENLFWAPQNVR